MINGKKDSCTRTIVLCCKLHVHSEKVCKISYLDSFRDLYVPQCGQLDARAKHPEVFSLCEPEHLPVPEVHGEEVHSRHPNPQFGKDDYPAQESIDIHLKQKGYTVWQSLDRETKKMSAWVVKQRTPYKGNQCPTSKPWQ